MTLVNLRFGKPFLFADDIQLQHSFPLSDLNACIDKINQDLQFVSKWSSNNKLFLNAVKTKGNFFCSTNDRCAIKSHLISKPIILNNASIEFVDKVKALGFVIDSNLSWENHIDCVIRKISFGLRTLYTSKLYFDLKTRNLLAQTLIMPFVNYGLEAYSGCSSTYPDSKYLLTILCVLFIISHVDLIYLRTSDCS